MKEIKSVGYNIECGGEILDDRKGVDGFEEYFEDGEVVSFEKGMKELKEYVCEDSGESVNGKKKWAKMEKMLNDLKKEVGDKGVWKLWGVEYDYSLGVEV